MQVPDHTECDVCGAPKGATNHWLVAFTHPDFTGIAFQPAEIALSRDTEAKYEDICSHACAVKRFSQWLGTLTPVTPKGIPDGKEDLQP